MQHINMLKQWSRQARAIPVCARFSQDENRSKRLLVSYGEEARKQVVPCPQRQVFAQMERQVVMCDKACEHFCQNGEGEAGVYPKMKAGVR